MGYLESEQVSPATVETTPVTTGTEVEGRSVEQQMQDMRKISEMRHKALSELVSIHVQSLTRIMLASNGVTELAKRQANTALLEAIKFTLDFGLSITDAKIRQSGVLAKEVNSLAGVLAQAMDTRMLLLADNLRKEENNNEKGEENGIA